MAGECLDRPMPGFTLSPDAAGRASAGRWFVLDEARRLGYRAMQINAVVGTNTAAVAAGRPAPRGESARQVSDR